MPSAASDTRAYEYFGAHRVGDKTVFRVQAPLAESVFLVGDFNGWDESAPMARVGGAWEISLPNECIRRGDLYKYKIKTGSGELYKSDPYGSYFEQAQERATRFFESSFSWGDQGWREFFASGRKKIENTYKINRIAWRCKSDGSPLGYADMAESLISDIKRSGCLFAELSPIMERSFDVTCGYRTAGFFAPSSVYGTPDGFRTFVDRLHRAGIGVVLDFAFCAFAKDSAGLSRFDGSAMYECDEDSCGRGCFNLEKEIPRKYLLDCTSFWITEYHADALRITDVERTCKSESKRKATEQFLLELQARLEKEGATLLR